MIDTESTNGTTAPTLLERHRALILALSAESLKASGRYSEDLYEESAAYYESIADTEKWAKCLIGLGLIFVRQGLSEKALATAQRAKSLNLGNE